MDYREFQIGNVYISSMNDKEYTFTKIAKGFAWVIGPDGIERPVSVEVLKTKFNLKK